MSVRVQVSQEIDRPIAEVFHFYAHDHVRNHPRWDPQMKLEQITPGPIGRGTVIRRVNSHSGTPVEGTMEVVKFEPQRSIAFVIHDSPTTTYRGATFEALSPNRTVIKISAEFPGLDDSTDTTLLKSLIERSARNIKHLVESQS